MSTPWVAFLLIVLAADLACLRYFLASLDNHMDFMSTPWSHRGPCPLLQQTRTYLFRIFKDHLGHSLVAEALDTGLLYTVASCGVTGAMYSECIYILQDLLPPSLAYYYTVDAIDNAFHEVQWLVHNEHFRRCGIVD
ncbi:hypothetical protein FB451DRAFT_1400431 [Mycena latifolia]|nr:hypothetical protein FB451DRAFT_1400431 [Mycena latifolia]